MKKGGYLTKYTQNNKNIKEKLEKLETLDKLSKKHDDLEKELKDFQQFVISGFQHLAKENKYREGTHSIILYHYKSSQPSTKFQFTPIKMALFFTSK